MVYMEQNIGNKNRSAWIWLFLSLETVFYLAFLWMDVFEPGLFRYSKALKFAGILLCFLAAAVGASGPVIRKEATGSGIRTAASLETLTASALLLTVFADFCLLLKEFYLTGLLLFIAFQALYCYRFYLTAGVRIWIYILAFAGALALVAAGGRGITFMMAAAVVYTAGITGNVVTGAVYLAGRGLHEKKSFFFCTGLVLFFLCDMNVALFNINEGAAAGTAAAAVYEISAVAMWFFYLPSQVLIALSAALPGENRPGNKQTRQQTDQATGCPDNRLTGQQTE